MKEYHRYQDDKELLASLEKIAEFGRFSHEELESMLKMGRIARYEPGETIIKQGEFDCWIYFLLSGLLEVRRDNQPIGYIRKRCELFGEISVIDAEVRSTSVVARKSSLVLGVDASLMDRADVSDNTLFRLTLYKAFSEIMAERIRKLTEENAKLRAVLKKHKAADGGAA